MLDTTLVYFAHSRDLDWLTMSIASARHAGFSGPVVVFADRDDYVLRATDGVQVTDFPRGRGLEGRDCVAGMIEAFSQIETDQIIKVDPDTVCMQWEDVDAAWWGDRATAMGPSGPIYDYTRGCAYGLSTDLVREMASHPPEALLDAALAYSEGELASHGARHLAWPEDQTISVIAQMLRPDANEWRLNSDSTWASDYDHATKQPGRGAWVNCGDRTYLRDINFRARVETAMVQLSSSE